MSRHATTDSGFRFEHADTSTPRRSGLIWAIASLLVVRPRRRVRRLARWCVRVRTSRSPSPSTRRWRALKEVAESAAGKCYAFTVTALPGPDGPGAPHLPDKTPDLWVGDSSAQVRRVSEQVKRPLPAVADSIAKSPVVVTGQQVSTLKSWVDVMKLPNLRMGSPIDTTIGDVLIMGALAEVDTGRITQKQLIDAMTILAVQQNNARTANDSEGYRLNLANTNADIPVLTTEQQFVLFTKTHQGSQLKAATPQDGDVILDHPLVNTAGQDRSETAQKAGKAPHGRNQLQRGQADPGTVVLPRRAGQNPLADGAGVGDVKPLTLKDPAQVDRALRQWQVLAIPIRTLVVEDVSGSMVASTGSGTRADLMREASLSGLKMFPNNAQIGFGYSVSTAADPGSTTGGRADPTTGCPRSADGRTHREVLADTVKSELTDVHGGTGLYDTTLAAYKKVQSTYDPNYSEFGHHHD